MGVQNYCECPPLQVCECGCRRWGTGCRRTSCPPCAPPLSPPGSPGSSPVSCCHAQGPSASTGAAGRVLFQSRVFCIRSVLRRALVDLPLRTLPSTNHVRSLFYQITRRFHYFIFYGLFPFFFYGLFTLFFFWRSGLGVLTVCHAAQESRGRTRRTGSRRRATTSFLRCCSASVCWSLRAPAPSASRLPPP